VKKYRSFTLIELLVTIIILGILVAIAIPKYTHSINQRKGEIAINNIRMLMAAEQIYKMKNGDYWPTTGTGWEFATNQEIKDNLEISSNDKYFGWGSNWAYVLNNINKNHFRIYIRSKFMSPNYYITIKWNPADNKIYWTCPVYANKWFEKYPATIPDDDDPSA